MPLQGSDDSISSVNRRHSDKKSRLVGQSKTEGWEGLTSLLLVDPDLYLHFFRFNKNGDP